MHTRRLMLSFKLKLTYYDTAEFFKSEPAQLCPLYECITNQANQSSIVMVAAQTKVHKEWQEILLVTEYKSLDDKQTLTKKTHRLKKICGRL